MTTSDMTTSDMTTSDMTTSDMTTSDMASGRLANTVALITGADSGIGQACAVQFAQEGANVVVNYLHDADGAERTRSAVAAIGQPAIVIQADVSHETEVDRLFDEAVSALGGVDILVNNAGVDASGTPVAEMATEVWEQALRTNLSEPFFCSRRFIWQRLQAVGGGKIVNVTSVHADIPHPGGAEYHCSKGDVRMLTRTLALELAEHRIDVNSLAPGMALTPINQPAIDDPPLLEEQVQSIPLQRAAEPADIARVAAFLASPDASTSPASYVIDGGLMLNLGQGA